MSCVKLTAHHVIQENPRLSCQSALPCVIQFLVCARYGLPQSYRDDRPLSSIHFKSYILVDHFHPFVFRDWVFVQSRSSRFLSLVVDHDLIILAPSHSSSLHKFSSFRSPSRNVFFLCPSVRRMPRRIDTRCGPSRTILHLSSRPSISPWQIHQTPQQVSTFHAYRLSTPSYFSSGPYYKLAYPIERVWSRGRIGDSGKK